jgi:hypothetical protein
LKEDTRLQLQRRFYLTAPIWDLRQIGHVYPNYLRVSKKNNKGSRYIQYQIDKLKTKRNICLHLHVFILTHHQKKKQQQKKLNVKMIDNLHVFC